MPAPAIRGARGHRGTGGPGCASLTEVETMLEAIRRLRAQRYDDVAILGALLTPCGHRGLDSSAYGVDASGDDGDVLESLRPR